MIVTVYDGSSGLCIQADPEMPNEETVSISTGDEQERLVMSEEMFRELIDAGKYWLANGGVVMTPRPLAVILDELSQRMQDQRFRLYGGSNPARFSYDRNGTRLGIAALEDEIFELYEVWKINKKYMDSPEVASRMRHEALDIASVAMLLYENIPE